MTRTPRHLHVLLIDDDEEDFLQLKFIVGNQPGETGYPHIKLDWTPNYEQGLEALLARRHDVYLIDYHLGARSGMDLLKEARRSGVAAPIIMLTGQGSYQVDLAAMQHGAADYLVKSHLTLPLLERSIRYAMEHTQVQNRLEELVHEQTQELQQTVNNLKEEVRLRLESESKFRALANTTSAAILILQKDRIVYANPAVRFVTGYQPDELVQRTFSSLVHPAYRVAVQRGSQVLPWSNDLPLRYEIKIIRKDGSERWLDVTTGQMEFEGAAAQVLTAFDITERDQAESALQQARDRLESEVTQRTNELQERTDELSALHAATSTLLTTLDLDELYGQILNAVQSALPAAKQAWLYLQAQESGTLELCAARGAPARLVKHGVRYPEESNYPQQVLATGQPVLVRRANFEIGRATAGIGPDAESFSLPVRSLAAAPLHSSAAGLDDAGSTPGMQAAPQAPGLTLGVLCLTSPNAGAFSASDLTMLAHFANTCSAAIQNAMLFKNVETLATIDPLTEQLNRRAFFDLGQRELERHRTLSHPLAVLIIDLDHFKLINDSFGHPTGDRVLRSFVDRCCERIRKIDLFGRYGGDEFFIMLPKTDRYGAYEIAERIRQSVCDAPVETASGPVPASVSIGIADLSPNSEMSELSDLVARADAALYTAKKNGRNRVEVYTEP